MGTEAEAGSSGPSAPPSEAGQQTENISESHCQGPGGFSQVQDRPKSRRNTTGVNVKTGFFLIQFKGRSALVSGMKWPPRAGEQTGMISSQGDRVIHSRSHAARIRQSYSRSPEHQDTFSRLPQTAPRGINLKSNSHEKDLVAT